MYSTVRPETFESIARKAYGDAGQAHLVAKANPGLREPIAAGLSVVVPDLIRQPVSLALSLSSVYAAQTAETPSGDPDEVTVLIGGRRFDMWSSFRFERALDRIDALSLEVPFRTDSAELRSVLQPFSYAPVEILLGGLRLFKGTLLDVTPSNDESGRKLTVSAYSKPGVLADCCAPASLFEAGDNEFFDQTLPYIAFRLCAPFGVGVLFLSGAGTPFDQANLEPSVKVLDFLVDLAKRQGLAVTSSEDGQLVFWREIPASRPRAVLTEGKPPLVSVDASFRAQELYSHVTGVEPSLVGLAGLNYTVRNPRLSQTFRPFNVHVPDAFTGDVADLVRSEAGRMYGNALSFFVELACWRDPAGQLWTPNTIVRLDAPGSMVYGPYDFVVRSVILRKDEAGTSSRIELCVPGAFGSQFPERLPWEG